jgi:hypothetical protein
MDGDIFGDSLVDDLLTLTGVGGDFDTSDLMDILEPDYLENNILLDGTGNLNSLGDSTTLDDLDNFSSAPMPSADVNASFDAALSAHEEAQSTAKQVTTPELRPRQTPELRPRTTAASSPTKTTAKQTQANQEDDDDEPQDPLESVTSGMLPQEDLEALARLAAGEDEFLTSSSDDMGLADSVDSFEGSTALETADFGTADFGAADFSSTERGGATNFKSDVTSSSKNLLDETLDERNQPSLDELEELALLASGGADLGSVLMSDDDSDDDDSDNKNSAKDTNRYETAPKAKTAQDSQQSNYVTPETSTPPRAEPYAPARQNVTADTAVPTAPRRFSQVARSWSQTTSLSATPLSTTPMSATGLDTPTNQIAPTTPSAELARNYRPPNQLRRYFNAGIMLAAADRLKDVLDIPDIPSVVFLGRAAERCLEQLPDHDNVMVAHLAGNGFVASFQVPRQESFRRVLMAKDRADNNSDSNGSDAPDATNQQQSVLVADISDLELDDLSVALEGTHLLLSRLQTDPVSHELKGTLTLVGDVDLRSGANFLRAIKEALESPITLMV